MIYFILALALIVRLIALNQGFWLDEAASLVISRQSVPALLSSLSGDFHPPFFYLLLHYWMKISTSAWFLRLPNILFSVASVFVLHRLLSRQLKDSLKFGRFTLTLADLAAILLAVNPLHIYYSQELRMYALSALLCILSWYLLLNFSSLRARLLYALVTILGLYTFYGLAFNLLSQSLYLLLKDRPKLSWWFTASLLSLLAFIPWLPTFFHQLSGGSFISRQLVGWSLLSGALNLKSLLLIPLKFTVGRLNLSAGPAYKLVSLITVFYISSLILLSSKHLKNQSWLFVWLFLPLILAALLSLVTPMLGYWRYIFLLPAFAALIALGIFHLPPLLSRLNLIAVILTFVLLNSLFWLNPSFYREDWQSALAFSRQPDSAVVFAFSDTFAPAAWYAPDLHYIHPLINLSAAPDDFDALLSRATLGKQHLFVFDYLSPLTDPQHNITAWLDNAGFTRTETRNFRGVGFVYHYQPSL